MRLFLRLSFAILLFSFTADASAELPFVYSPMKVLTKKYGFDSVNSDVTLVINHEQTLLGLDYVHDSNPTHIDLVIVDINTDGCGSRHIYARLNKEKSTSREAIGRRYSVHMTDHSQRRCRDMRKYLWEADVRSGYGWCGTMDSVMTLGGNPDLSN